eukprot:TRINITY_DN1019_c0_g1_i4.p1 TRINITY_DN1019_c0_g1~~TRINITY_DN1019_c0_g1_i4.p1  ORF type:complete len:364 (-),score=120.94 TRINITY_DN1019_c0_g1_i4:702-1793(-)
MCIRDSMGDHSQIADLMGKKTAKKSQQKNNNSKGNKNTYAPPPRDFPSDKKERRGGRRKRGRDRANEKAWQEHFAAFQEELKQKGLYMRDVDGDGNCLFRSIADQLEGTETNHKDYRMRAVDYMRDNPDDFRPYIDEDEIKWDDYLAKMSKDAEWGDHMELQALSQALRVNIIIHMKSAAPMMMINFPKSIDESTFHLAYHVAENIGEHYSSVRLIGDEEKERAKRIDFKALFGETEVPDFDAPPQQAKEIAEKEEEEKKEEEEETKGEDLTRDTEEVAEANNEEEEVKKPDHKNKGKKKHQQQPKNKKGTITTKDLEDVGKNSKCPCGSGKKYKNCCVFLPPAPAENEVKKAEEPKKTLIFI